MKMLTQPMKKWSDIEMVEAVTRQDVAMMERFYRDSKSYFRNHAGAFFLHDDQLDDIFQEAMVHLWREIETRRIVVCDGMLCRQVEGQAVPMTSNLYTFLLAIAKRKHWEQLRKDSRLQLTDEPAVLDALDRSRMSDDDTEVKELQETREGIVADAVLAMSDRCRQILTLFYYEQRTLDEILALRSENTSKVGLKTSKYKCMQRLREQVKERFARLHLSI